MSVQIVKTSRLRFGNLVTVDGAEFWDVLDLPTIPIQTDDVHHVIGIADRIDLIANRYYGDPVLWWVIAAANDLEILPTDLVQGDVLRIPAPRYVTQVLFQKA